MADEEIQDTPQDETPDEAQETQEPTAQEPTPQEPTPEQPETPAEADSPEEAETAGEEAPDAGDDQPEQPAGGEPAAEREQSAEPEQPAGGEPAAEREQAAEGEQAAEPEQRQRPPKPGSKKQAGPEVIPGEHLEPDLVLEEEQQAEAGPASEQVAAAEAAAVAEAPAEAPPEAPVEAPEEEPAATARTPVDLAADARYHATGKRKSAVARVVLKPGTGAYKVNGRELDEFFQRPALRRIVRQPLDTAGYTERMDVVAKIHGGGVSSQAGALRHGVARALVEADPNLRGDLKREGFLRRDPRVKERKKAGLKKARKRPQFSKR